MEEEVLIPEIVEEDMIVPNTDQCPGCNTLTCNFKYITFLPQLGWLECTECGTVFCPESIRVVKRRDKEQGRMEPRRIIIPGIEIGRA
jgi:hypothetical protein